MNDDHASRDDNEGDCALVFEIVGTVQSDWSSRLHSIFPMVNVHSPFHQGQTLHFYLEQRTLAARRIKDTPMGNSTARESSVDQSQVVTSIAANSPLLI
jgi:hypothetical protein